MYRSVIVPLDRSAVCEHVLPVAAQIAHGSDATLRLVSPAQPAEVGALESGMRLEAALASYRSLPPADYLEHIRSRLAVLADLRTTAAVLHEPGNGADADMVAHDTDLVVLATYDGGGSGGARLGTITEALVHWCPAPILVLRADGAAPDPDIQSDFQRMLIPLDGSATAEQILVPAVALGTVMEATYTLLHVIELERFVRGDPARSTAGLDDAALGHAQAEAQDYLDSIALLMRAEGLQVRTRVVVARGARSAIRQVVHQQRIDVIAMTTHRRGGFERLLLGSVAVQVLNDSLAPVLLCRPQERREFAGYE
jgi:nucleotide-binding universal stress UspA family protein